MGGLSKSKTEAKYNKREVLKLKEVFDDADKDGSGEIEANELQHSLKKTNLGEEAVNMFKSMDRDGSKKIDFSEYLRVYYRYAATEEIKEMMLWAYPIKEERKVEVKTLSEEQQAEIKSIFVLYDTNNNGTLEKKELIDALSATGYDDDEIEEMFEDFDQDGDNQIDFEEFCKMLESSYLR
mmetsp:Transcript_36721/g.58985  ORF Transcript_36721/g.58985 Transcript_36721/m.58985 type:complete len:181 (-) Transcript_36721:688-1230(-)